MAVFALQSAFVYAAGHDFTGDTNQAEMSVESETLDVTNFGSSGWREVIGGLRTVQFNMSGFWQADGTAQVDDVAFSDLGVSRVFTVGGVATETEPCYLFQADNTSYQAFGEVGQAAPFTLSAAGTSAAGAVRGRLALAKTSSISATGAVGSGVQLTGGVSATEYLYATWHVFPTAGTTITIDVESDDNGSFTTPTSRGTIGPVTATGGTWMTRVAGAITDDWYRFNVTAVTGSFTAAGAIGVGT